MATWHIITPDDATARTEAQSITSQLKNVQVGISWSFGNGPAIVVVTVDDGVEVQSFTTYPATVVETTVTVPQSETSVQVDEQVPSASEPEGEHSES